MGRRILVSVVVLAVVGLVATVAWASLVDSSVTMNWDEPGFSEGYVGLEWADYGPSLFYDVQVRRAFDGSVVGSQTLSSDCVPGTADDGPGVGQCGTETSWSWETDDFLQEDLEMQRNIL